MDTRHALQQAIEEMSRQRVEIERLRAGSREPIAVVGMGCRFPGASTIDEYWALLARGGDAITEVPRERWRADAFYDADVTTVGKMATRQGGFIRGADQFDPLFFGIAPREAQNMDPQQRLLLEVTWEALEHAGIAPSSLYGSDTGVFVGITCFDHAIRLSQSADPFNSYSGTGSALNMAPGRLSYVLGLTGPSMAVDTACSSSLVSLHLACQSLRARETSTAIVGGVHLILSPHVMVSFSQARMLSGDGRSKTFDASADGYSRGEGCGVVVLKRLSDAVAQGDRIVGLIRGTAVNQDGPSGGLTVPNGAAQQQVIRRALDMAGVAAPDVQYVEAHGTGTSLGDPIEVEAAATVYGAGRSPATPLLIGSVKTNIGHLEPAAGMAGLIKMLLAFEHAEIPRHLHLRTPNPHIPWDALPVKVVVEPTPWPRSTTPRLGGVSAFGFSGTNAHIIVEEPPVADETKRADGLDCLIPLTAKSEAALVALAARYLEWLQHHPSVDVRSVALTAGVGRAAFAHRLVVQARNISDLQQALDAFVGGRSSSHLRTGKASGAGYRRDATDVRARLDRAYAACTSQGDQSPAALADITTLFLEGVAIDWARLYGGRLPARVSLPTYPFERQRYWVETPDQTASAGRVPDCYELLWTSAGPVAADVEAATDRRWTVVPGDRELADRIRDLLLRQRADVSITEAQEAASTDATDILFLVGAEGADDTGESCRQLLELVHGLASSGVAPRVSVVTRAAVPVAGAMTVSGASQAPLAAFARVLGLEHPEWSGRVIDLDSVRTDDEAAVVVGEVLREDSEDQVAIRSGTRFVQRIERVADVPSQPLTVRADATYLVTGGLGRIGLLIAADLVRRGARSLCLVSRHGVVTPHQRESIAAIEAMGAGVRVAVADVSDAASMASLIESLDAGAPLAGVVHAAGMPGYIDTEHLTAGELQAVLRPKIEGAWHLHQLTRRHSLEFFVCVSSIASAWGSRGQAHYAAGNAYLDALSYLRRASGLPSVTINWGPWVEGGMTSPEAEALLRRVGIRPLPTDDALTAFAVLARADRPQVIVADIDWELFRGSYEARGHRRLLERLAPVAAVISRQAGSALAARVMAAAPLDRVRLMLDAVRHEVALVLELPDASQADPTQGLFEMGLDSLMAVELRTRLQALVGCALPATLVFDYPNIKAIAHFVVQELVGAGGEVAAPPTPASAEENRATQFDALSDEDAEALLLKKLESLH